jgi:dimeric dUTPase (all-alpha-NTP-PPase superfamily)
MSNTPELPIDKLEAIFAMQTELNNTIFSKRSILDCTGKTLSMQTLIEEGKDESAKGPETNTNRWLEKFLTAMDDESRELRDELLWKWWSKDSLDMQNIRVEIIDQLHFWVSLALTAGLNAESVMDVYKQKHAINHKRQQENYSKASKTEADNQTIEAN